ncbi:Chitin bind 4 domain containing protein [Asbolus verrucosus]|uniref:Chitin bind 4 domain containing protein n=1 Tax=Asbolus verrucosus TaxID=1661398 RepID=A0A482V9K6_ASBVE|nr:Chitin bind 4 domain containing protein [Asbolus verrucosus]
MKLFLMAVLVSAASAGRLDNNYGQPQPQNVRSGPTPPPPAIVRLTNDNPGDGSYKFDFETENRITQQEIGAVKNAGTDQETNVIQGSYSYTGPDGVTYTVNYIADENGFRASGDHIPTAAPVPAEIAEAVQQNIAEEAAGYSDDGQYRPEGQEPSRGLPNRPQKGYRNY